MKFLQGFYLQFSAFFPYFADAFCGGDSGRHGGHIGNLSFYGSLADIAVVETAFLAGRRIDDELNLSVCNGVIYIGTPLLQFLDLFSRNAGLTDYVAGPSRIVAMSLCEPRS